MSERRLRTGRRADRDEPFRDEEFTPTATMVLMLFYIAAFATLWGLVYYLELLARR
jgi:hypothetical protein